MALDDPLDHLAAAVSDGDTVDWDREESDATRTGREGRVRAMRDLAAIAGFNRVLQSTRSLDFGTRGISIGEASRPERWGPFILLEQVGAGAAGEVWRGWEPSLQREVAIKFLQASSTELGSRGEAMLLEEARAVARVRHPGVVTVYGIAEHDGRAGLWMEFLRGASLAREIERRGALPPVEVARLGAQLASALEALDHAGLVHRDVKPANIVMEADGRAVLADFGLGLRQALAPEGLSGRGSGTPLFMAPSLLDGGAPSPRTDLYALGVTLRWALTGRAPFRASSLEALKAEAAQGPKEPLAVARPDAPPSLVAAIDRAIDSSPAARAFNAAEMGALLRAAVDEAERAGRPAASDSSRGVVPSIAVLPFLSHGPDEEDEYFADGLADELLHVLSRIRGLQVAARTSSFQFKGRHEDPVAIGRKLNVATLLEGSVRRMGRRVRISVRLVKVLDGYQIWSESYDRTLDDIFAVQDDIAQSVLTELRQAIFGDAGAARSDVRAEVAVAARGRGSNAEAHRLFLLGRHLLDRGSREFTLKGIDYLRDAVALDEGHALAWAELSRAWMNEANGVWISISDGVARARDAALRALSLAPDLAEAHARLGSIQKNYDWDWKGAEASYRRALEIAPGSSVVLDGAGVLAESLGKPDEAIELMRRSVEKDPLSAASYSNLGITYHAAGRLAEAEEATRKAIELAPERITIHSSLALILLDQGRHEEALAEALREPEEAYRLWALTVVHHAAGRREASDESLRALIANHAADWAYQVAEATAARGDADEAFRWLERAYEQRDPGLAYVKPDPLFRPLHADPRWNALIAKMGLAG